MMKKLLLFTGCTAFLLAACSTGEDVLDNELANDVYQRRTEGLLAIDFTTLFTYDAVNDAQQKMSDAFAKVTEHSKRRLQIEKGATEAILHVVAEDGKCILWAEHYLDRNNGRMVESIHKKQDSHIMCIGTRENYPALYAEITKSMAQKYSKLGNYSDAATTTAINNLLDTKLNISTGSAEFRLRVTDSSTEVYALK